MAFMQLYLAEIRYHKRYKKINTNKTSLFLEEKMTRLVYGEDKNDAYDKVKRYIERDYSLMEGYEGDDVSIEYNILIKDTIQ